MHDATACLVLQLPEPRGGGSLTATKHVWKRLIAAPTAAGLFARGVRSDSEAIDMLQHFRDTYGRIDVRDADPELVAYIADCENWATNMISVCERDQQRQRSAGDIELFAGLVGATLEKNSHGDRDEESLERGMQKGSQIGHDLANAADAAASSQINADGVTLMKRGQTLTQFQDALAMRLEMTYHVFFPPKPTQ